MEFTIEPMKNGVLLRPVSAFMWTAIHRGITLSQRRHQSKVSTAVMPSSRLPRDRLSHLVRCGRLAPRSEASSHIVHFGVRERRDGPEQDAVFRRLDCEFHTRFPGLGVDGCSLGVQFGLCSKVVFFAG
jgi:hypothetical protein